ncbi:hypothetical protein SUGI_1167430 [Cryptomeria japonica]|nr:hypothetical protein SUGI_1167430 [Cryptomeria japonica]
MGSGSDGSKRKNNNENFNSMMLKSDALLLPLGLTNKFFFVLFFAASYFLMGRWREKIRASTPLPVVSFGELVANVAQLSSFIYLLGFFGIDYVQNFISKGNDSSWDDFTMEADFDTPPTTCEMVAKEEIVVFRKPEVQLKGIALGDNEDANITAAVCNGTLASYSLESSLGDCKRVASVRRTALELMTGRSLDGFPLEGFNYQSIL